MLPAVGILALAGQVDEQGLGGLSPERRQWLFVYRCREGAEQGQSQVRHNPILWALRLVSQLLTRPFFCFQIVAAK